MPADWKYKEVEDLTKKLSESPVVAVAGVKGLPSKQFQEIRARLKGKAEIKVVKNRLANRAFEKAKKKRAGLDKLEEQIEGPTALIFSEENPFKLYSQFEENRISAAAKPGDTAPYDIVIPAGDTPFKPGPIIGDLQKVGIKAKIQGGIIAVVADSPVAKKGEAIGKELASVLSRMEVEPMQIGVNVKAAFEDGMVYDSEILHIDKAKTLERFASASAGAFNLAVNAEIYNEATIEYFLSDGKQKAVNLSVEAGITNKESVKFLLSKAQAQANSLNAAAPTPATPAPSEAAPPEEKKEEAPADEAKPEEKAEEAKETPAEEKAEEKKEEPKEAAEEKPAEEAEKPAEEAKSEQSS